MSRQLRTQRCRSSKYSHAVRNLYDSDPDDPRPSTSGEGPRRLRNAPESHFYLYETASGRGEMRVALDSSAQPAKSGRSTAIPNIPDSDWDMDVDDSDDDADYSPEATESDADWEEFDYVSSHDTSIDSDEPLSAVARRFAMRNAPGTPGFVWKKKRPFVRRHPFQGVPGVEEACLLHADSTAREILDCFLTPELWDTMTRPVTPSSHMKTWENTTVEELQSFIGLRLLMGLQPRPHSRYYWSKNRLLSSSVFPETMTRDRFDLLQSRLHFSDNEDPRADTDRLWKLRPVLDILDTTFKTVYIPDRKIVVDESLWAFRGPPLTISSLPIPPTSALSHSPLPHSLLSLSSPHISLHLFSFSLSPFHSKPNLPLLSSPPILCSTLHLLSAIPLLSSLFTIPLLLLAISFHDCPIPITLSAFPSPPSPFPLPPPLSPFPLPHITLPLLFFPHLLLRHSLLSHLLPFSFSLPFSYLPLALAPPRQPLPLRTTPDTLPSLALDPLRRDLSSSGPSARSLAVGVSSAFARMELQCLSIARQTGP
ncbi:hypothetical protein C7M84_005377 [Penaeus vannamei]|uniref:PiggyBac transposable element-derived protein domain-containing protein n=1 Tax=Penaeus vannamei TaxID=6689 RepID=A0A423TI55_PENVA|nr:hypothetical protein C7M84_005377 [Penaeus vannamei]